ncbi:hypothetical protein A4X06_0g3959 [Tilletia controversa]|uniref:Uncharacterized protein n=1 Tax=Tilletia controversa TaxID=13291 RepID=A0A8X7SX39_9BASI|nr:hypothetical protein A4X06_0g3959 [Tilletia controversa]
MAPKKRKDPEDNVPSGSGNPDFGSLAQGQGQVQFQGNDTSDGHPDLEENEQPFKDPDIERLSPDPNRQRDASDNGTQGNPAQHNRPSAIDIQDMTLEELELELELKTLRKAILQKKKNDSTGLLHLKNPLLSTPNRFFPNDRTNDFDAPDSCRLVIRLLDLHDRRPRFPPFAIKAFRIRLSCMASTRKFPTS